MVNVMGVPEHITPPLVKTGVTVNVDVMGIPLAFVAVNAGTLPAPFAGIAPISGLGTVRVQLYTAPGIFPVNVIVGIIVPAQTVWLATCVTVGTGLIVMVNVIGALEHVTPLLVKVATTVNVEVSGVIPALVAVKEGTLPVPAKGARPIAWLVLDQEYVAPGIFPVNTTDGTVDPAQYV